MSMHLHIPTRPRKSATMTSSQQPLCRFRGRLRLEASRPRMRSESRDDHCNLLLVHFHRPLQHRHQRLVRPWAATVPPSVGGAAGSICAFKDEGSSESLGAGSRVGKTWRDIDRRAASGIQSKCQRLQPKLCPFIIKQQWIYSTALLVRGNANRISSDVNWQFWNCHSSDTM